MKVLLNRTAVTIALGAALAAPIAAQNPSQVAASCDPTANTKGDIARAQFSMTRAIAASEKGNPTRDLQEVLKLVDNGNDNPTARNYLRGEAYIIYLSQPNAQAVVPRSTLGPQPTRPARSICMPARIAPSRWWRRHRLSARRSSHSGVSRSPAQCAQRRINALNAGQLDSAEISPGGRWFSTVARRMRTLCSAPSPGAEELPAANDYGSRPLPRRHSTVTGRSYEDDVRDRQRCFR